MEWACFETVPGSMMGSIRANPTRPGHSMRQKAWVLLMKPAERAIADLSIMLVIFAYSGFKAFALEGDC